MKKSAMLFALVFPFLGCGDGDGDVSYSGSWSAYVTECQADGLPRESCECAVNQLSSKYSSPAALELAGEQAVADILAAYESCGIDPLTE